MITNNPMQLKTLIKKQVAEKNISAHIVMQNYMMERLLERISLSHESISAVFNDICKQEGAIGYEHKK